MRTRLLLLTTVILTACSYVAPSDGGETGGPPKINQGPPEGEKPPQWVCKERVPLGIPAGADEPYTETETCYYSPATTLADGWPGKPHWYGLPDEMMWVELAGEGPEWLHPMYVWYSYEADDGFGPDDGFVLHYPTADNGNLPIAESEFRSGLIGNFAFWLGGVPDEGLRPPIVTASFIDVTNPDLPTIVGHPFYEGRYNAYGMPCSSNPPAWGSKPGGWTPTLSTQQNTYAAECRALVEYENVVEAHNLYPFYFMDEDIQLGMAQDEAACLSNDGLYDFRDAVLLSGARNGLTWINWGGGRWEAFVQWIQQTHPELHALIVALDFLQNIGWGSWPLDPDYPYQNWSFTGVCGHPAALKARQSVNDPEDEPDINKVRTYIGCPTNMVAKLPDLDLITLDKMVEFGDIVWGYCTFPLATDIPSGVADATPIDVLSQGKPGQGFDGGIFVELASLTEDTLADWADSIAFETTPGGMVVHSKSLLGRDLLAAFNVPEHATIVGINNLIFATQPGKAPVTVIEAMVEVDRALSRGEILFVVLDTADGARLHRYVIPQVDNAEDSEEEL